MIRRLLLTNDDGIQAVGLSCLATVLASRYEIQVVAPDRERSGVAHAFTLHHPLRCDPAPGIFPEDLVGTAYRCSGTPVDCVKMALLTILPERPDLVVSGINAGANLAIDSLYSGTVAGAMEASMMGVPSMAVSLVQKGRGTATRDHFETAAEVVLDLLTRQGPRLEAMRGCFLNINVPGVPREEIAGLRATVLGRCHYRDAYRRHVDPTGRPYYWLEGDLVVEDDRPEADLVAVRDNFVSVTPLGHDLSRPDLVPGLLGPGGPPPEPD